MIITHAVRYRLGQHSQSIFAFIVCRPTHCPKEFSKVFASCQRSKPVDRPSFKELFGLLSVKAGNAIRCRESCLYELQRHMSGASVQQQHVNFIGPSLFLQCIHIMLLELLWCIQEYTVVTVRMFVNYVCTSYIYTYCCLNSYCSQVILLALIMTLYAQVAEQITRRFYQYTFNSCKAAYRLIQYN